jgi:hypothetical protein
VPPTRPESDHPGHRLPTRNRVPSFHFEERHGPTAPLAEERVIRVPGSEHLDRIIVRCRELDGRVPAEAHRKAEPVAEEADQSSSRSVPIPSQRIPTTRTIRGW